jgi:hypothetical protein
LRHGLICSLKLWARDEDERWTRSKEFSAKYCASN